MGDWEDGAGSYKADDLFDFGRFPMDFVRATLSTGIGEWFSERVKVEGVRHGAGGLVGVGTGKTHFGGKSSARARSSSCIACAFRW